VKNPRQCKQVFTRVILTSGSHSAAVVNACRLSLCKSWTTRLAFGRVRGLHCACAVYIVCYLYKGRGRFVRVAVTRENS